MIKSTQEDESKLMRERSSTGNVLQGFITQKLLLRLTPEEVYTYAQKQISAFGWFCADVPFYHGGWER